MATGEAFQDYRDLQAMQLMETMARHRREERKGVVTGAIQVAFPKATRQQLVPLLQKEGWDNLEIVEILEGIEDITETAYP